MADTACVNASAATVADLSANAEACDCVEFQLKSTAKLTATFTAKDGVTLINPAGVVVFVQDPKGGQHTYAATHDSLGQYHFDLQLDIPGTWIYKFQSLGPNLSSPDQDFTVQATTFNLLDGIPLAVSARMTVSGRMSSRLKLTQHVRVRMAEGGRMSTRLKLKKPIQGTMRPGGRLKAFLSPAPLLDQLALQPLAAWSNRIIKSSRQPINGTYAALSRWNDQSDNSNHATPVGFSAAAADTVTPALFLRRNPQATGLRYFQFDGADDAFTIPALTLGTDCTICFGLGIIPGGSATSVLGKVTNSAPYIRVSSSQVIVRNATAATVTISLNNAYRGFNWYRIVITSTLVSVYINGTFAGSGAIINSSGFGQLDRIGMNQTGNWLTHALGEVLVFNGVQGAPDAAICDASGEGAWRTALYVAGDTVANNNGGGFNPATAWRNYDLLNGAVSTLPLRPGGIGATIATLYGATISRSPFYIIDSTQQGSAGAPNWHINYGNPANGVSRGRVGNTITGGWTDEGGGVWSTPIATCTNFVGSTPTPNSPLSGGQIERMHWFKAGFTPVGLQQACEAAYAAAGPGQAMLLAGPNALWLGLDRRTVGNVFFPGYATDATKLYVNIGQNPTGQELVACAVNGLPTPRGYQIATNNWTGTVHYSSECPQEDCFVASGTNVLYSGESLSRRLIGIGGSGDGCGGKGGGQNSGNLCKFMVVIGCGDQTRATSASAGDAYSWHGGNGATMEDCDGWLCAKGGINHEEQPQMVHRRCRMAGNNQNYQILDQAGGTGSFLFEDCEGKFAENDALGMISFESSTGPVVTFTRGLFYGASGVTENRFCHIYNGATGTLVLNQVDLVGHGFLTPNVLNEGGVTVIVNP